MEPAAPSSTPPTKSRWRRLRPVKSPSVRFPGWLGSLWEPIWPMDSWASHRWTICYQPTSGPATCCTSGLDRRRCLKCTRRQDGIRPRRSVQSWSRWDGGTPLSAGLGSRFSLNADTVAGPGIYSPKIDFSLTSTHGRFLGKCQKYRTSGNRVWFCRVLARVGSLSCRQMGRRKSRAVCGRLRTGAVLLA